MTTLSACDNKKIYVLRLLTNDNLSEGEEKGRYSIIIVNVCVLV